MGKTEINPKGPARSTARRAIRGAGWRSADKGLGALARSACGPLAYDWALGLRVVLAP